MSTSRPTGHEPRDCNLAEIHRPHVWTRDRPGTKPCWCVGKGYDDDGRPFSRSGYSRSPHWLPWKVWVDLGGVDNAQRWATAMRVTFDVLLAALVLIAGYALGTWLLARWLLP